MTPESHESQGAERNPADLQTGFCIYINTLFQGAVPVVSDCERYTVFETELEAQKEIADHMMTRLRQFLDGERDFEDAITTEECVFTVTVHPDGVITDENGGCFSSLVD
jgi:hypothetical protein